MADNNTSEYWTIYRDESGVVVVERDGERFEFSHLDAAVEFIDTENAKDDN
jgi:hypothetical protein